MAKEARIPTGLRLEPAIIEKLREDGQSLPSAIRDRLDRTFKEDAIDPVTREIRDQIVGLSELIRLDYGTDWHQSVRAHEAFAAGVAQVIADYAPTQNVGVVVASDLMFWGPDDPPEAVGRLRARDEQRRKAYPMLEKAVNKRKRGW
jgi:hypothetical protein